jgi:hypothetical protein
MIKVHKLISIIFILLSFTGCASNQASVSPTPAIGATQQSTQLPTSTKLTGTVEQAPSPTGTHALPAMESKTPIGPTETFTATPIPSTAKPSLTPRTPLKPDEWKNLPVVPKISDTAVGIYQRGLKLGNDPHAFSKIGDCGSTPAWFLGDFDRGPDFYRLGEYQELEAVIGEFKGSFDRTSLAARSGFNASSLFVPLWADRSQCDANETPLACEYRNHRPLIAFIMLGANDVWHPEEFEPQMRKIIEYSIENGVVPVLSTKADNQEGDYSINATIAQLAWEYDIPLWNFWLAVQDLPNKGLQEDQVHLTWGRNFFDDPDAMSKAWPVRNLTALQTLDALWRKATGKNQD